LVIIIDMDWIMLNRRIEMAVLIGALLTSVANAKPVKVSTTRLPLNAEDPADTQVGSLKYRGGLVLTSDNPDFGGFSALGVSEDGKLMIALSDRGRRFSARLVVDEAGNLAGLRSSDLATMAGLDGRALSSKSESDAEAMSPGVNGEIIVAFERNHRLWLYPPNQITPIAMSIPEELKSLKKNSGIEALTLLNDGSLISISEGNPSVNQSLAWVSHRQGWSVMTYTRSDGFRVTGAATLPGGDIIVLERLYTVRGGSAVRIKRLSAATIVPGAALTGATIAELRKPLNIDNFEGIEARSDPTGANLLYIISDDNFSNDQRTLLMVFELKSSLEK